MKKSKYKNKNYAEYVKSYKSNKRYRDKIGDENFGAMYSEREWKELYDVLGSNKDIVYNQFHFYSREKANQIQKSLGKEGFKLSIKKIQNREYTPEMYKAIKEAYNELKTTMSAKDAANLISYTYYGSN